MEGVKGSIFIFVVALLVLIPYGMRRHDLVATHLAPLNGFVFGLQEVPYEFTCCARLRAT